MKIISLLFYFIVCGISIGYSQPNTNFGTGSGTLGSANSFFGADAGKETDAASNHNVGVGFQALSLSGSAIKLAKTNVAVGTYALSYGGEDCTAVGHRALSDNQQYISPYNHGISNTAVGSHALSRNNYGKDYNTAVGARALSYNNGDHNTAFGYFALNSNQQSPINPVGSASYNTAFGSNSMLNNKDGWYNTASGASSLYSNINGELNTANGYNSLFSNTSGYQNTAVGSRSLYTNSTGYRNTAIGGYALNANISGNFNTATGNYAMYSNNIGTHNTGDGYRALYNNTTGNYNTADGSFALYNSIGGSYNTAVGYNAGPNVDLLNNTTALGYLAVPTASNQVRIGNASVTSIGGQVEWTAFSDGRFKKDIKEDVSGLEFIEGLRPVSYTVDKVGLNKFLHITDSSSSRAAKSIPVRQTGFVAQEVDALIKKSGYIFSGVDAPENENDPYGIRYSEFVVPLVKAVQELSAEVKEQRQQIQLLLAQLDSKTESIGVGNTSAALVQNSPNPFDSETVIQMTLPDHVGTATVMVYNLEGKQMKNLHVSERGEVKVKISASELSAGMYLYSLIADGKVVDTKRMVLTK